jgi:hypothetical protein
MASGWTTGRCVPECDDYRSLWPHYCETDAFEDTLVCATLDLNLLAMSTGRRWIHGRRPELYAILSQNQGYERDARSARFSTEVPQFSDNTQH